MFFSYNGDQFSSSEEKSLVGIFHVHKPFAPPLSFAKWRLGMLSMTVSEAAAATATAGWKVRSVVEVIRLRAVPL